MPLYGNILLSTADDDENTEKPKQQDEKVQAKSTAPSASMKLLQDHLMSKRRSKQAHLQPQKIQKLSDKSRLPVGAAVKYSDFDWDLFDEYDPMVPNDYEIFQLEAIKVEEQRLNAMKSSVGKIDPSILDVLDRFDQDDEIDCVSTRGAFIAPPPPLKQTKRSECDSTDLNPPRDLQKSAANTEKLDGISAAAKIMAKMGFKIGQGLGRNEQGINAPLEVEKSGPSLGRIVQRSMTPPPVEAKLSDTTRVLLLQNMVGPGEVDDDLEEETKQECTKYGNVVKCLIYEIPNNKVPDDEAVRIFIEFEDCHAAKKAANELNGRYFGGRSVRASFYDVDKFHKYQLGF